MDLTSLSLAELKKLHKDVAAAITNYEDRTKAKARAELEAQARAMGFKLAELMGMAAPRKRSLAVAKYRHPENPVETWSGRGRQPRWFAAALAAGKTPDDRAIKRVAKDRCCIGINDARSSAYSIWFGMSR